MSSQDTHSKSTRRKYTTTFKRELVERCLRPGASVSGIALENGINANVLFRWRREHVRGTTRAKGHDAAHAVLVPVNVAAEVTPAVPQATPVTSSKPVGIIEIDIGGARVRLHGQVDESNVRCVLHTLRGLS
ncbi:transposase [Variovorax sp. YR216]|uniref:IS66-like element accessory protein TnpA n=1 Tax=Variovorax sp. YR216 TaxID=1882828 RepID=UPI00089BEFA4|nr:transposase [Variovorax sp. YR216]SEB26600.1 transposase [Variovorax sp. YR216]